MSFYAAEPTIFCAILGVRGGVPLVYIGHFWGFWGRFLGFLGIFGHFWAFLALFDPFLVIFRPKTHFWHVFGVSLCCLSRFLARALQFFQAKVYVPYSFSLLAVIIL